MAENEAKHVPRHARCTLSVVMHDSLPLAEPLTRREVRVVQVNVGKKCNQACHHCHVEAGPKRTEAMTEATLERLLRVLEATPSVEVVDITGGAPELHAVF